jgi:hypothetical protein
MQAEGQDDSVIDKRYCMTADAMQLQAGTENGGYLAGLDITLVTQAACLQPP